MSTISKFPGQQLSKTQMNHIKGGKKFECVAFMSDGSKKIVVLDAADAIAAADAVHKETGAGQVNCVESVRGDQTF